MNPRPTDNRSFRIEHDSLGEVAVPAERRWGAQTQRALEHFRISSERWAPELVRALAQLKRAAAIIGDRPIPGGSPATDARHRRPRVAHLRRAPDPG
jgi:hypothetical protein